MVEVFLLKAWRYGSVVVAGSDFRSNGRKFEGSVFKARLVSSLLCCFVR